jgi:hypothetical protein
MYDDVIESYLDVLREYQNNSRDDSATIQCMGILKGIHKFEDERMNDLFDWGLYDSHKKFKQVIEEWRKANTDPRNLKEMDEFVMENFPEWHEDTLMLLRNLMLMKIGMKRSCRKQGKSILKDCETPHRICAGFDILIRINGALRGEITTAIKSMSRLLIPTVSSSESLKMHFWLLPCFIDIYKSGRAQ